MASGKGSKAKALIWAVPLLAIIGFGGFGAVNFSGSLRSIGSVGDTEITTTDYANALQSEMRAFQAQTGQPLTVQQARDLGLTDKVLALVVTNAAMDEEAQRLGISVGDEKVAEELGNIDAFKGPDGNFSRDAYAFALKNAGLNETDFESGIRDDAARALLQAAVLSGTALPDVYVDTLLGWTGETRAFTWARIGRDQLATGLPVPSEEDLKAWYDANLDRFTVPETKVITYAWLTPAMIVGSVEVDEQALRAAYEERFDEFNLPERRLIERLVFGDEAEAEEALSRLRTGDSTFEDLIEERGLDLADADMGDVTKASLGEAGEALFFAESGDVVGPAWSPLGPAVYRVNGILAAQETPFEEAEPQLRDELALDRARRVIDGMAQSVDDELAGGATLEELAKDTDLELGQIAWTAQSNEGIAGYDAFRTAAGTVAEGDYPEIDGLGDGGIFALRLDEIRPPAPQPYEEVTAQVQQGWEQDQATQALVSQGEILAARIGDGATFEDLGLRPQSVASLTRDASAEGVPAGLVSRAFGLEPGTATVVPGAGEALVLRLDTVTPVDLSSDNAQRLAGLVKDQAANAVAQDLFRAYNTDLQARAGVTVDQAAVNAVLTNFR
ncbi:peptidyl-prolyl cis-trans isomerase [Salipiger sp.]|uniref:peptidyl-prolyl cis-trans isomerase n=1 Tax=Salipiger sp. TaxID=2078585 RepID=UPI003A96EDF1